MYYKNIIKQCALITAVSFSSCSMAVDYSTFVDMPSSFNDALNIDSQGNIYVSNPGSYGNSGYGGKILYKVTPDGIISDVATSINGTLGHDFDSNGNIYVANANDGSITKISPDGASSFFADLGGPGFASNIKINSQDEIFVTGYSANAIFKLDLQGNSETWIQGNGFSGPVGLDMDEEENIYVSNYNDGRTFKIQANKTMTELSSVPSGSGYITYGSGAIYATGINTNKIYRMSVTGGEVTELEGSSNADFTNPNGIVMSNDGNKIYVSNYSNNKIIVIENFKDVASTLPQTNDDSAEVNQDSEITIDILSNDTSTNITLDLASVYLVTAVQNGITSIDDTTGSVTYTPSAGYSGTDSFAYTVNNTDGETSNEASVSITIASTSVTPSPVPTSTTRSSSGGTFDFTLFTLCLMLIRKSYLRTYSLK